MESDITIVMPTCGHAEFLLQALGSVFQQTLLPAEVIVMDDGSPDTEAVLAPYVNRVRYVRQDYHGMAHMVNSGVGLTETDYILFLPPGEWLDPSALAVLKNILDQHQGIGIAHGTRVEVDEYLRPVPAAPIPYLGVYADIPSILTRCTAYAPAVLYRRQALVESGPIPNITYSYELAAWLSIALSGWHFYGVPEVLGFHRRPRHGGTPVEELAAVTRDEVKILNHFVQCGQLPPCLSEIARSSIQERERALAWEYLRAGDRARAKPIFVKLLRENVRLFDTLLGCTASLVPLRLYKRVGR